MMMLSAGLIGYSAMWTALRLMGEPRLKSASRAIAAWILTAFVIFLCEKMPPHRTEFFVSILYAIVVLGYLLILSNRKWIPSFVSAIIYLLVCLIGQQMIACFKLEGILLLIPGVLLYVLVSPLWDQRFSIFSEDLVLNREQRKNLTGLVISLFLGPIILLLWNIYVLMNSTLWIVPILLFNIVILISLCFMLGRLVRAMKEHVENVMDKQYQAELLNFMGIIRSQRHDFNFHMQTVYGMIFKEQYEPCKEYISSMLSIVRSSNDVLPLANPTISALLNTFQEMARQKGLRLDVEIHDNLSHIPCSVYEMNTLLGNLIQNAIDELDAHTEGSRVIQLLIIKRGNNNMIKVSNYCHQTADAMREIFTPGYSTKPKHEGLGLANANRIAEKYSGALYPEFDGHTIHMIARIPMKLY
jgi:two-component system, LytTR family, sensor histidine kinase AgrC